MSFQKGDYTMKRITKFSAFIFALIAALIMALPVSAAAAEAGGKETQTITLTSASKKVDISKCKITYSKTASYTGKAVKPKVTVKNGKKTLKSGTHYKVSYSSNKKIGTAKITITGISKNGYTGSTTVSFKIVPAAPSVKVSKKTTTSATLSWSSVKGAQKYIVYKYANKKYTKVATTEKTSYTIKKLTSATKYTYVVKSYAKKNYESAYSSKKTFYTLPDAVKNLKATAKETSVTLSWSKVQRATGYIVYKVENGKYTKLNTTTNLSYTVSKLTSGTKYTYAVAAYVSKTSYLGAKTKVSVTTTVSAPAQVKGLKITVNSNKATASWSKTANASGYTVYSFNNANGKYTVLGNVTGTSYSASLSEGKGISLAVAAYKTVNSKKYEGEKSAVVSAANALSCVTNINAVSSTESSISLSWDKKNGAEGYDVYTYNSSNGEYTCVSSGVQNTSVNVTGLKSGTQYSFTVVAYFTYAGEKVVSPYSELKTAATACAQVTNLKIVAYTETSMNIKWNLVTGANIYYIYSYDPATKAYTKIGESNFGSYNTSGLEKGKTYSYAVSAVKAVGSDRFEGKKSEIVSAYSTKTMPENLKKTYNTFKSGTFSVTYSIPYSDTESLSTETYVKGNNLLLVANVGVEGLDLSAKTYYLGDKGKAYIVVPFGVGGFYEELTLDEMSKDGMSPTSLTNSMAPAINENIPYTIETKVFNGKTCTCEGFVSTGEKVMSYYYYNNNLVAIEETSKGESTSTMEVTSISSTVNDKVFDLPWAISPTLAGYVKIDLS